MTESSPQSPPIFTSDGAIDETALREQFGLGIQEATQEVAFGSYTGTVAEMLADRRCPVGGMVSKSFREAGIEGVISQFSTLSMMDSGFKVEISELTLESSKKVENPKDVKKNSTQIFPSTLIP